MREAWHKTKEYEHGKIEKWPQDGMRHSFTSYHLAQHENAPITSLQMGHTSPRMLFNHYRNLVLPADAERYWKIRPEEVQAQILTARVGASTVQANPLETEQRNTTCATSDTTASRLTRYHFSSTGSRVNFKQGVSFDDILNLYRFDR